MRNNYFFATRFGWLLPLMLIGCSEATDRTARQRVEGQDPPANNGGAPNQEDPNDEEGMEGEEPTDAGAPGQDAGGPSTDGGAVEDTGGGAVTDAGGGGVTSTLYIDFVLHFVGTRHNNCVFLRSRDGKKVDVSGYVLRSENSSFALPSGTSIPAGDALVVHWNSAGTNDADDVWTGAGLGNLSTTEDELIFMRPASATNRVVAYVRWDTDGTFGNAPADPYGTPGVSAPTTALAVAAGLWDSSYVNVTGVNFIEKALQLADRSTAPGTTASDWTIITK